MKALAFLALAATAAIAMPAAAQVTLDTPGARQGRYIVSGAAPEMCAIGEPTISSTTPAVNVHTAIGRVVEIQELADPKTLSTQAASVELAFAAFCNYPHRITLESDNNGLFRQEAGGLAPVGFASAIPYRAELRWEDDAVNLEADALNRREVRQSLDSNDAVAGPLLLRLRILPGATNITTQAPLLAGEYRDIIRITVTAQ